MHEDIEFQRFKGPDALFYYITFDNEAYISKATIYVDELQKFIDITSFVKADEYWQGRVEQYLTEYKDTHHGRKFWKVES
jgi:hypothetical protein